MPSSPLRMLLLLIALIGVATVLQVGIVSVSFEKLGLSQGSADLLLVATLLGSVVNLPLFSIRTQPPLGDGALPRPLLTVLDMPRRLFGRTLIAVNVGGCLVPLGFCIYLLGHDHLDTAAVLLSVASVALVAFRTSESVPGLGIRMPLFVAPLAAALLALLLSPEQRAPLAYVAGTLGVLIGADLLHFRDFGRLGTRVASIGGAGTFDGIFLTGLVAVLLS